MCSVVAWKFFPALGRLGESDWDPSQQRQLTKCCKSGNRGVKKITEPFWTENIPIIILYEYEAMYTCMNPTIPTYMEPLEENGII